MTDNDKMREEFEKWAVVYDLPIMPDGIIGDEYSDGATDIAWKAWQAAKSVPVVGEVLFFASYSTATSQSQIRYDVCADQKDYSFFPVVRKPTHSITEAELKDLRMCKIAAREEARRVAELTAELERMRKDAERWRVVKHCGYAMEEAIDAAIVRAAAAIGEGMNYVSK